MSEYLITGGHVLSVDPVIGDVPRAAVHLPNDTRAARYVGAAPPAGHGPHRDFITVHALDVEDIGVAQDATRAILGFTVAGHILGRATLIATAETPAS